MLETIISGGQTGVDQASWRAAQAVGLKTGGWMPKGYLTESGGRPEFAELYGAKEMRSPAYPARTEANIREADATLILPAAGYPYGPGTLLTVELSFRVGKPRLEVVPTMGFLDRVVRWIHAGGFRSLNVAGPRESSARGVGVTAEKWLILVFEQLRELEEAAELAIPEPLARL